MVGVNSPFEMSVEPTLNGFILQRLRSSAFDVTLCVYTRVFILFEIKVNRGSVNILLLFTSISKNNR